MARLDLGPLMHRSPRLALLVLLAGIAACQPASSQVAGIKPAIAAEQLREDLDALQVAIVRRHPRFHDQPPGAEFVRAFQTVRDILDRPMTRDEAFRLLARLNPVFDDAHTVLVPTFVREPAQVPRTRFPFAVRLDAAGRLLLRGDWHSAAAGQSIESGTIIGAINGVPAERLIEELAPYSHGESEALRRHMLTVMFADWLTAIRGWQGRWVLELEHGERRRRLEVSAGEDWALAPGSAGQDAPVLRDIGEGIAVLKLPTFDVDDDPGAFRVAIGDAFGTLRRSAAHALILDLRGNTGGQSDAGAEVIRYLIDRPVNQVSRARERLNEDNRGFLGYKGRAGAMREMDLSRDGLIRPAPASERFRGRVVLLIDAMTYSAGILFATTLQDHGLATLVGESTGGYANQTGNMEPVTLPHTGLVVYIPSRIFVRPSGDARMARVKPDIEISMLAAPDDAAVNAARAHLLSAAARAPR